MPHSVGRRDLLKLLGLGGGVVFASSLAGGHLALAAEERSKSPRGASRTGSAKRGDFYFVQMSDTHWGFQGPLINPRADATLPLAVQAVNRLAVAPDFVVFTGDLTHTTDDAALRRKRMDEFKGHASKLQAKDVRFMPGEHDASLDNGEAFREKFGPTHLSFDHKGIHFVTLDNVSDPKASLGDAQLQWLEADLAKHDKDAPVVVFTHRPLFDLMPSWDWATADGAKALEILKPYRHVTVFYGHIHQEHHFQTGAITHHAARSLMFPLPAPGSVPKRAPIPWDPNAPFRGLGFREVEEHGAGESELTELPLLEG